MASLLCQARRNGFADTNSVKLDNNPLGYVLWLINYTVVRKKPGIGLRRCGPKSPHRLFYSSVRTQGSRTVIAPILACQELFFAWVNEWMHYTSRSSFIYIISFECHGKPLTIDMYD